MHINDLRVYSISVSLEREIMKLVSTIPFNWNVIAVDQIKRSSESVSANIIEGFGRRMYPKDYVRFLNMALASSDETQHHLLVLRNNNYINEEKYCNLCRAYKDLSIRMLNLILFLKKKHGIHQFI